MKGVDTMSAEAQLSALPCKAPILTDAHNKRVSGFGLRLRPNHSLSVVASDTRRTDVK